MKSLRPALRANAPRAGVEAGRRPPAGMPLFLRGTQPPEPAASTTDGVTTFRPDARTHPRAPEIEAHEAVHRAQFAASAPRGSRVELEQDAHQGARTLLAGQSYAPTFSASPGQTLNFDPDSVPLMPDIGASTKANAKSLSTLGEGADRRSEVKTSSSTGKDSGGVRTIKYHIDASGAGRRGSVNTATDISVTYDPGKPSGMKAGAATMMSGEFMYGPAIPVPLYPVVIRYRRELRLKDADGRDVTVTISSDVNFTHESWAHAIEGKPLTFETLLSLRGDAADVWVVISGTGPLQPYYADYSSNGVSLNIQSAVAEVSLQAGAGLIPFASNAPARFVRPELTAGEQFDSLEAFLVSADAAELARRAELERQRREELGLAGRFLEDSGLAAALDWLSEETREIWDSLPAPVRGVLAAIGQFAKGVAFILAAAAAVVLIFEGAIGFAAASLIVGAIALVAAFVSSVITRTQEAVATGIVDPNVILSVAVLDTIGLGGFIEAMSDESLISGQPLNRTTEERWEAGTTGLFQMVATAFGIRGAMGRGGVGGGGKGGGGKGGDFVTPLDQTKAPPLLLREPPIEPYGPVNKPGGTFEPNVPVEPVLPGGFKRLFTAAYGKMTGKLPEGIQANHLNQNAAFAKDAAGNTVIPKSEGVAVAMRGKATSEPGTPHYEFHRFLEAFWEQFRPEKARANERPTCGEYSAALNEALQTAGFTPAEAAALEAAARENRQSFGLSDADFVPRIPGKMRQKK